MTQTTTTANDAIAAIIAEAMQPARTRKPLYELKLSSPHALRSAAKRAQTAASIADTARAETDDPTTRAAITQLLAHLGELEYAADLLNPDEFGEYDGDPYAAAAHAQADIESAAAQLSDADARPRTSRKMIKLDEAAARAGLSHDAAYAAWNTAGANILEAIGGVYYVAESDIPQPPSDDDPPPSGAPIVTYGRLEFSQAYVREAAARGIEVERAAPAPRQPHIELSETARQLRADRLHSLNDGSAYDVRGELYHLRSAAAIERRRQLINDACADIPPIFLRTAAINKAITDWRLSQSADTPACVQDIVNDRMMHAAYIAGTNETRSEKRLALKQAVQALELLAAAIATAQQPPQSQSRPFPDLVCPDCASANIGKGSITGDPFCRDCHSDAVAGPNGIWQGVTRQLAGMIKRNRRPSIERAYVDATAEIVEDDDSPDDDPPSAAPVPEQQQLDAAIAEARRIEQAHDAGSERLARREQRHYFPRTGPICEEMRANSPTVRNPDDADCPLCRRRIEQMPSWYSAPSNRYPTPRRLFRRPDIADAIAHAIACAQDAAYIAALNSEREEPYIPGDEDDFPPDSYAEYVRSNESDRPRVQRNIEQQNQSAGASSAAHKWNLDPTAQGYRVRCRVCRLELPDRPHTLKLARAAAAAQTSACPGPADANAAPLSPAAAERRTAWLDARQRGYDLPADDRPGRAAAIVESRAARAAIIEHDAAQLCPVCLSYGAGFVEYRPCVPAHEREAAEYAPQPTPEQQQQTKPAPQSQDSAARIERIARAFEREQEADAAWSAALSEHEHSPYDVWRAACKPARAAAFRATARRRSLQAEASEAEYVEAGRIANERIERREQEARAAQPQPGPDAGPEADAARAAYIELAPFVECPECGETGATPHATTVYPTAIIAGRPQAAGLPRHEDRYRCDRCAHSWPLPALDDLRESIAASSAAQSNIEQQAQSQGEPTPCDACQSRPAETAYPSSAGAGVVALCAECDAAGRRRAGLPSAGPNGANDRPARLRSASEQHPNPVTAAVMLELAETDPAEHVDAIHYIATAAVPDGWITACGRSVETAAASQDPADVSCAGCRLVVASTPSEQLDAAAVAAARDWTLAAGPTSIARTGPESPNSAESAESTR